MITGSNQVCSIKLIGRRVQEVIVGRTPFDGPQKGGLPLEKLAGCVIRIEEFKR